MDNKLKQIMAIIFDQNVNDIDEESSQNNIPTWDSLKHMNLIVALEEEFDIVIDDEYLIKLLSYKDILEYLKINIKA